MGPKKETPKWSKEAQTHLRTDASPFTEKTIGQVEAICGGLGATTHELAAALGVSVSCIEGWKEIPEFREALYKSKAVADRKVKEALLTRACGFYAKEEKVTTKGEVIEFEKYHPPHVTAAIFWLKCRQPDEWGQTLEQAQARASSDKDAPMINVTLNLPDAKVNDTKKTLKEPPLTIDVTPAKSAKAPAEPKSRKAPQRRERVFE